MTHRTLTFWSFLSSRHAAPLAAVSIGVALFSACGSDFASCEQRRTCEPTTGGSDSGGTGDPGASGSDGNGTGDQGGAAGSGGSSSHEGGAGGDSSSSGGDDGGSGAAHAGGGSTSGGSTSGGSASGGSTSGGSASGGSADGGIDGSGGATDAAGASGHDAGASGAGGGAPCEAGRTECPGDAATATQTCSGGDWVITPCPEDYVCRPSTARCAPIVAGCETIAPGGSYCVDRTRLTCGSDLLSQTREECSGLCIAGACAPATCGDGVQQTGEECDDGNDNVNDDCVACKNATCGDGFVWAAHEACDRGDPESTACPQCQCPTVCTLFSTTNIAGGCCVCDGAPHQFVRSSFSPVMYVCQ